MSKELEDRIERFMHTMGGNCPECFAHIKGWKAPMGLFAPEAWETLRSNGIDPATGHYASCSNKKLRLS